jgi:glycerol-3-phosphate O-acyltransferase
MLPSFGPAYYLSGLPYFFRHLRMEDHSAERIRRAAEAGPVVYVLHTRSYVDWLAVNRVLVDRRLPLPEATWDLDPFWYLPLASMWHRLRRRTLTSADWLGDAVQAGRPTCIFLARPWDVRDLALPPPPVADPLPPLLAAQAASARPIQLVPLVVIWSRSPEPARTEVGRFLLGTQDNPGVFGKLLALTTQQGDALVQAGEPIAVPEFLARYGAEEESRRFKVLRLALRRFLYREARVVRGPRARPFSYVQRQVMDSPEIRGAIAKEAAATGATEAKVRARAARALGKMAARFSFPMVRLAGWATWQIWNRVFSGIDVREADLDRIRAALRDGTPVLVPCHRSHLDYLLISSLLLHRDIVIPHIVAGDNLAFFPLGAIFRRCGAFFIKRSFAGDRIFPAIFARYVRELVRMEVPIEFFIEGGRSRTGKLLPPKLGVLGMVVDAAMDARREVSLLPVYVGYEQIAEERVYARELGGAKKEREDVGQVVKATSVLAHRYGKVYLRVGEAVRLSEVATGDAWRSLPRSQRHEQLMAIGERLLHRINAEAVALPTALVALALLAHPRRGMRHVELRERVERLRTFLAAAGVQEGGGMSHVEGIVAEAVQRFSSSKLLDRIQEGGETIYTIAPAGRVSLEYYKNAVLHAFAPAAYFAAAVRALGAEEVDRAAVSRLFRVQAFVLRFEFILDPDADESELERRAVAALAAYGAVDETGTRVRDRKRIGEIANLVANFHESYLLALRTATAGAASLATLPDAALLLGRKLLAADELRRPEALNLQNLQNAARSFGEDGVLTDRPGGGLAVQEGALKAYADDLTLLLAEGA